MLQIKSFSVHGNAWSTIEMAELHGIVVPGTLRDSIFV